jgi:hypothetical protein
LQAWPWAQKVVVVMVVVVVAEEEEEEEEEEELAGLRAPWQEEPATVPWAQPSEEPAAP